MSTSPPSAPGAPAGYRRCPACNSIYPGTAKFCTKDRSALVEDERIIAGKFILLRKIGEGTMGEVYEAEQPKMRRKVALKLLRADPVVMQRFDREVEAAGSIAHPNVVTIYESGRTEDGRGYLAMEYLEGQSLARLMEREGVLVVERALPIWVQAVRAMAAAHAQGVVHRDLKPDNIFIARRTSDEGVEELVKVLDFGIAKLHESAPGAGVARGTTPGAIVGTMQYMAPEQLEKGSADLRSDVFSLGLILVEMLTGRLPWGDSKDQSYGLFALRLVRPPLPLYELLPGKVFSPELERLVSDTLARDPAGRPTHAGELLQKVKLLPEAGRQDQVSGPSLLSGPALLSGPSLLAVPAGALRSFFGEATTRLGPPDRAGLWPNEDERTEANYSQAELRGTPAPAPSAPLATPPSTPTLPPLSAPTVDRPFPGDLPAEPTRVKAPPAPVALEAPRRFPIAGLGLGLLAGALLLGGVALWSSGGGGRGTAGQPDLLLGAADLAHRPPPPDLASSVVTPPIRPSTGPEVSAPEPRRTGPTVRPALPLLQVQFAFLDAKGVRLICGGKERPPPDCSGSMCKFVVSFSARQKCVVEKDNLRKTFSYGDIQKNIDKNKPDLKGIIHIPVLF